MFLAQRLIEAADGLLLAGAGRQLHFHRTAALGKGEDQSFAAIAGGEQIQLIGTVIDPAFARRCQQPWLEFCGQRPLGLDELGFHLFETAGDITAGHAAL